jgi:hypothetical protein
MGFFVSFEGVIDINWLIFSLYLGTSVITLSGFHCIKNNSSINSILKRYTYKRDYVSFETLEKEHILNLFTTKS